MGEEGSEGWRARKRMAKQCDGKAKKRNLGNFWLAAPSSFHSDH